MSPDVPAPLRKRPRGLPQSPPDLERGRESPWLVSAESSLRDGHVIDHRDFAMLVALAWEGGLVAGTSNKRATLRRCSDDELVNASEVICETLYAFFPDLPEEKKAIFGNYNFLRRTERWVNEYLKPPRSTFGAAKPRLSAPLGFSRPVSVEQPPRPWNFFRVSVQRGNGEGHRGVVQTQ